MRKKAVLIFVILCVGWSFSSNAQSSANTQNKHFYFGVGVSYGFFYPGDVNDYIKADLSHVTITSGVEDLFLNLVGRMSFTIRVHKAIDLSLIGEYAWAPKLIVVSGGEDIYFHFNRFSPGLVAKFHVPVGSGKNTLFFAPGITYNLMKFEVYKANALGAKAEIGFSFNYRKFSLQPFVCYDYAKAIDDSFGYEFELNYSGAQIGVDFVF
jgi:hypothetical protein